MFKDIIVSFETRAIFMLSAIAFVFMFSTIYGQVYAQQEENITTLEPSFLFIQSAQSGSLSQINDTAYTLELNDVADKTVSFSDRPDRIVESVSTSGFVGNWSTGEDSFAIDPPNAVLIVLDNNVDTSEQEIALVELFNPVYDEDSNALTYDLTPDNETSIDLPNEFGQSVMIIDSACSPWDPRC
jgi:hypothetical protein